MALELDGWTKNWHLMNSFFTEAELTTIKSRLKNFQPQYIVLCSFENRFARSGGLAAATIRVLPYLNSLNGVKQAFLLTPYYPLISSDNNKLQSTGIIFTVHFSGKEIPVEILKYSPAAPQGEAGVSVVEYYLKADGFFNSVNELKDPYIYHHDNMERNNLALKENSLFFCAAAPLALQALGFREDIVFHLQEWQTAAIALTAKLAILKDILVSAGTVQTMHNPFDTFLELEDLKKIAETKYYKRYHKHHSAGLTAYQLGLQLVDGPITTVSKNFALEFVTDIFQTFHFASHLQDILKFNRVYGVNNGTFEDALPEYQAAEQEPDPLNAIKKIKLEKRRTLLKELIEYKPAKRFGELTYKDKPLDMDFPEEIPIIVMSGRLDPVQKGYDILLRAMERFGKDEIKVVLTPMPVKASDLNFFQKVAKRSHGCVTIFPIRMERGYKELQTGSTFGVMPSIYEPFGAAIEYMTLGTVTIARATGGLVDQVEHEKSGFLFKEEPYNYCWENIHTYNHTAFSVEARSENPWVMNMVDRLYETLLKAVTLYRHQPEVYYQMILNGFKKALSFNWDSSAYEYWQTYQKINDGC